MLRELTRTIEVIERSEGVLHLAFVDLDHLKYINDTYGHDIGDGFLVLVANRLVTGSRQSDFVGRYGGDEFVVFGLDYSKDPVTGGEEVRRRIESITSGEYVVDAVTFEYPGASVGVATYGNGNSSAWDLIAKADRAMYFVKQKRKAEGSSWIPKAFDQRHQQVH